MNKILLFGLIAFVAGLGLMVQASTVTDQTYQLIKRAYDSMVEADLRLNEIEGTGVVESNNNLMEVSLAEITSKFTVSRDLLDKAISDYQQGEYRRAALAAIQSRQNTILTTLYLEALLNRPTSIGVNRLGLDGDLSQLIGLREVLSVRQPIVESLNPQNGVEENQQQNEPQEESSLDQVEIPLEEPIDQDQVEDIQAENDILGSDENQNEDAAVVVEEEVINETPSLSTRAQRCFRVGNALCDTRVALCNSVVSSRQNRCSVSYDNVMRRCSNFEVRSNVHQNRCQVRSETCLTRAVNDRQRARCETNLNNCLVRAEELKNRDLNLFSVCQQTANTRLNSCNKQFSDTQQRLTLRCETVYNRCSELVNTRCSRF